MTYPATAKTYSIEDFKLPALKEKVALPAKVGSTVVEPTEIAPEPLPDNLGEIIPSDLNWVEVIVTGDDPPGKTYPSRSERMIACLCWMLANGVKPRTCALDSARPGLCHRRPCSREAQRTPLRPTPSRAGTYDDRGEAGGLAGPERQVSTV